MKIKVLLAILFLSTFTSHAQITVTSTADGGPGSLRQALADASSPETINFAPSLSGSTLTLSGTELLINTDIIIDASSLPRGLTIDGGEQSRIFNVQRSGDFVPIFNLKGLTLTGGNGGAQGGAIRNTGVLRIENCTLTKNTATSGGAIYNAGFDKSIGVAAITIVNSTIVHNESADNGGAIYNDGAGENIRADLTLTNCTITNNTAKGSGDGGGIFHFGRNGTANMTLRNTIIAENSAGGLGPDCRFDNGSVNVDGISFVGTTAGTPLGGNTDILSGAPLLAPLGYYGGPTQTMHPLADSPTILSGGSMRTDQRGFNLTGPPTIGAVKIGPKVSVDNEAELRTQLANAANTQGKIICFASSLDGQTITLTPADGQLPVPSTSNGLFIDASSLTNGFTIDANQQSRVMEIQPNSTVALHSLTLTGGNATGNSFPNDSGGGIFANGRGNENSVYLTLNSCTLSGNSASDDGGGIYSDGSNDGSATLNLNSCTLSSNSASSSGGGIFSDGRSDGSANLILNSCTLSGNSANFSGGIFSSGSFSGSATLSLSNSILAGNTAPTRQDLGEFNTTVTETGNNLLSGDPLLAPLGFYGGPTQTMLPLPGSPAINAATSSTVTTDQRGFPITDGSPDIGAVEFQGNETELNLAFDADFDQDGTSVGVELALGTDPFTPDADDPANLSLPSFENGQPIFTFGLDNDEQSNIILRLVRSTDLITFDEIIAANETTNFPDPGDDLLGVSDPNPPTAGKAFYRLEAEKRDRLSN